MWSPNHSDARWPSSGGPPWSPAVIETRRRRTVIGGRTRSGRQGRAPGSMWEGTPSCSQRSRGEPADAAAGRAAALRAVVLPRTMCTACRSGTAPDYGTSVLRPLGTPLDPERGLRAIGDADGLEDARDVRLDGLLRDAEAARDELVGQPLAEQLEHLALAGGQRRIGRPPL